jgi:hypothetical protein
MLLEMKWLQSSPALQLHQGRHFWIPHPLAEQRWPIKLYRPEMPLVLRMRWLRFPGSRPEMDHATIDVCLEHANRVDIAKRNAAVARLSVDNVKSCG